MAYDPMVSKFVDNSKIGDGVDNERGYLRISRAGEVSQGMTHGI